MCIHIIASITSLFDFNCSNVVSIIFKSISHSSAIFLAISAAFLLSLTAFLVKSIVIAFIAFVSSTKAVSLLLIIMISVSIISILIYKYYFCNIIIKINNNNNENNENIDFTYLKNDLYNY